MQSRDASLFWGVLLLALGAAMLLINLGWLSATLAELWPLLVLVLGVWLTAGALRARGRRGLTAGVVLIAVGGFWFAAGQGWLADRLFLPVLLMAFGLGLLLRGGRPR